MTNNNAAMKIGPNSTIECNRTLVIRKPPPASTLDPAVHCKTQKKAIKTFGFIEQGASTVDLSLPKDAFTPKEMIIVNCKIDNSQCDKKIVAAHLSLRRELLFFNSHGEEYIKSDIVVKKTFEHEFTVRAGAPIEQKQLGLELTAVNTNLHKRHFKKMKQISKEGGGLTPDEVVFQDLVLASTRTSLIQCSYFFEVSFEHAGITLGDRIPSTVFPVHIYSLPAVA